MEIIEGNDVCDGFQPEVDIMDNDVCIDCIIRVLFQWHVCWSNSTHKGSPPGDPLSLYLFLLCVEGLSTSLSKAASEGHIHGSRICQAAPTVTHLLFADDGFLFFRANRTESITIKNLLNAYERMSGQSVNFQKSGIHFSSNVKHQTRTELSNILGVTNSLHDSKYMGLSSLVGRSKKKVFGFIKDREMERVMNKYWWNSKSRQNRGINWLGWNDMSVSRHKGGLGFRSLYGFNIALIGKQCWRLIKEPQSLVARIFKARYFITVIFYMLLIKRGQALFGLV
ncbi:uncharacterized protein LOC141679224 [Apium graveolens]|uniref:uncharacterized protein LOC141679224 n=1 Tax=Apium graveolens TaxID=4045 RepID=UPI003D7920F6